MKFPLMLGHQANSGTTGPFDTAVNALSPLAWWKLADAVSSSTAADSSGHSHTGTANNVTFGAWSPLGSTPSEMGASFTGSSSVTTSYNPSGLSALSVMFIMDANGNTQNYNRIFSNSYVATGESNAGIDIMVFGTGTYLQLQADIGNGTTFGSLAFTNGTIPLSGSHIIVVTWDGTTIRGYIDGVLDSNTGSLSGTLAAAPQNLAIGYEPANGFGFYTGELAQVALFGAALTQTQVNGLVTAASEAVTTQAQIILGGRTTYADSGNAENAFIQQIGGSPANSVLMEYLAQGTWSEVFATYGGFVGDYLAWPGPKMIKVPMCQGTSQPAGGAFTWNDVTSGSQDANFLAFFRWCLANSVQHLCFGWEQDGNWYPWSTAGYDTTANQQGFVAVWQHLVNLARSVSATFKFWWNPDYLGGNSFPNMIPGGPYYPGDSFVDVIGYDLYNDINTTSVWPGDSYFLNTLESGPSPNWNQMVAYAVAHNKELCVPEWGMHGGGASSGGDDPTYISNCWGLFKAAVAQGINIYVFPWNNVNANPITNYPNSLAELTTLVTQGVASGLIGGGGAVIPPTLSITQLATQNATVGIAFSVGITAEGGTTPYHFTATGIPAGLSLNGSTISGSPTGATTSTVTITVTDSSSPVQTATMSFVFDVVTATANPSGQAPPSASAYPGYTLVISDDFLGTGLSSTWGGDGTADSSGFFQNPTNAYGAFIATQGSVSNSVVTILNSSIEVSGTPTQSGTGFQWTSGTLTGGGIVEVMAKCSAGEGISMMMGLIGQANWPPQIQFYGDAPTGTTRQQNIATTYYNNPAAATSDTNSAVDATQWNVWGVKYNANDIYFTVNGATWATLANPGATGTYGTDEPMYAYFELGSGISALGSATPAVVTMEIDWVVIYQPSASLLQLNAQTNQNAIEGQNFSMTLGATGGTTPYAFSATDLPPGISLIGATISGDPSTVGTYTVDVTVEDSGTPQQSATQTFTITVAASGSLTPAYPPPVGLGVNTFNCTWTGTANASSTAGNQWGIINGRANNGVTSTPSNVNVVNGQLVLTLSSETVGAEITTCPPAMGVFPSPANGGFSFTYGYVECSFVVPAGGWWAVWTVNNGIDGGNSNPPYGEFDIAENLGSPVDVTSNYHGPVSAQYGGGPWGDMPSIGQTVVAGGLWQPGVCTTYYNGVQQKQIVNNQSGTGIVIDSNAEFLILNIGVNSGAAIPSQLKVNYIRVWPLS